MENNTTALELADEQRQCLLGIGFEITFALVCIGQDRDVLKALNDARSIVNSDQAIVHNILNHLARNFVGIPVAEIGQLKLRDFITGISMARLRTAANIDQNIDIGHPNAGHGWSADLSAGTDGSQSTSVSPLDPLLWSDQPADASDDIDNDGDTVMTDRPLCETCPCKPCQKRRDRAMKDGTKHGPAANGFLREDLCNILDKYWLTLQDNGLYLDRSTERFQWPVEINMPDYAQRRQYHLILRHLKLDDELHPWRRFVAEYKTLEGYNEVHHEVARQKFNGMQARESGENDSNRAHNQYVRNMFPKLSPKSFSEAKAALKNDLQFARRWAILVDGFIEETSGAEIPGLGVGIGLVYGPGIKKKIYTMKPGVGHSNLKSFLIHIHELYPNTVSICRILEPAAKRLIKNHRLSRDDNWAVISNELKRYL